jgi:hypothetical protein
VFGKNLSRRVFPDRGALRTYNFSIRSAGFRKQKKTFFGAATRNNPKLLYIWNAFQQNNLLAQLMLDTEQRENKH